MKKISNDNTEDMDAPGYRKSDQPDWHGSYVDFYLQARVLYCNSLAERLSKELVAWAKDDDDALILSEFYLLKGIPSASFYDMCGKYECLMAAKKVALRLIGIRREKGAIKNKFNSAMILRMQPAYDKEWYEVEERRAAISAKSKATEDKDIKYTIVVDNYADRTGPDKTGLDKAKGEDE